MHIQTILCFFLARALHAASIIISIFLLYNNYENINNYD